MPRTMNDKQWVVTVKTWATKNVTAKTKEDAIAAANDNTPGTIAKSVVTAKKVKA